MNAQPSISDLLARTNAAHTMLAKLHDSEWNEANEVRITAENDLLDSVMKATGLNAVELRMLGDYL